MHNLYIMWLYDLQFITCKIVLFSDLVLILLHLIDNLLACVAALLMGSFWASVDEWLVRETQVCYVADF